MKIILFGLPVVYFLVGLLIAILIDRPGPGEFGAHGRRITDDDRDARVTMYLVLIMLGPLVILLGTYEFWRDEVLMRFDLDIR